MAGIVVNFRDTPEGGVVVAAISSSHLVPRGPDVVRASNF